MTDITTPLQDLIDLCIQAEKADGKVVPILPSTFFTSVAFALDKYREILEGGCPGKSEDALQLQEVIEKVRTSNDMTASIYINAFAQQASRMGLYDR